jgi:hypothetical protein
MCLSAVGTSYNACLFVLNNKTGQQHYMIMPRDLDPGETLLYSKVIIVFPYTLWYNI